jgi:hypothetical protein
MEGKSDLSSALHRSQRQVLRSEALEKASEVPLFC